MPETSLLHRMTGPLGGVADFGGRMRRADFWPYMLLLAGVYGVGLVAMIVAMAAGAGSPIGIMYGLTAALVLLAFAATVRRLHDVGWSGRWMAFYVLLMLAYIAFFFWWRQSMAQQPHVYAQPPSYLRFMPLLMAVAVVANGTGLFIFVLCFLDGLSGPNAYGPDPKGRSAP